MKVRFFDLAKKMSKFSDHIHHKIGGIIVYKSKIVSMGFNRMRTNPNSNAYNRHTHCELDCILRADREYLENSTIYLYRETKQGTPANSRPCCFCMVLLREAKITEVCYTNDGKFVKEKIA
jgi:deoxycytidylate deaminase